jgi:hypothetical protein
MYFRYVRELQFDEKPDYSFLKDLFVKLMIKNHFIQDFRYDWTVTSQVFIVSILFCIQRSKVFMKKN